MNFVDKFDFNDDERVLMNKIVEYEILDKYSKEAMIADLTLCRAATIIEYKETYSSIIEKIKRMSNDEWVYLKKHFPLWVSYDYDSLEEEDISKL